MTGYNHCGTTGGMQMGLRGTISQDDCSLWEQSIPIQLDCIIIRRKNPAKKP